MTLMPYPGDKLRIVFRNIHAADRVLCHISSFISRPFPKTGKKTARHLFHVLTVLRHSLKQVYFLNFCLYKEPDKPGNARNYKGQFRPYKRKPRQHNQSAAIDRMTNISIKAVPYKR